MYRVIITPLASILLQADIPGVASKADALVTLLSDVHDHNSQRGLRWVTLIHGLHNEGPLALGHCMELFGGLDVPVKEFMVKPLTGFANR